jgi:hypothetical protein
MYICGSDKVSIRARPFVCVYELARVKCMKKISEMRFQRIKRKSGYHKELNKKTCCCNNNGLKSYVTIR